MTEEYIFPAIKCMEGSLWHVWLKRGAIWVRRWQILGNFPKNKCPDDKLINAAAELYVSQVYVKGSNVYNSCYRAFFKGARNYDKLRKVVK